MSMKLCDESDTDSHEAHVVIIVRNAGPDYDGEYYKCRGHADEDERLLLSVAGLIEVRPIPKG